MSLSTQFYPLTVAAVDADTDDSVCVSFDVPPELDDTFHFTQGQHLTIRKELDGEELRRNYSLCTPVGDRLTVAIRKVSDGRFSSWANESLQAGEVLDVMPPQGRFFTELDETQEKHYLALAAGSGITPIASLIATTLAIEPASRFTLVYGNRRTSSIMLRQQLEHLKNRYPDRLQLLHVLSRESRDAELFNGRVDPDKLALLSQHLIDLDRVDEVFLCGPESMILSLKSWLETNSSIGSAHIHIELFGTESGRAAAAGPVEAGPSRKVSIIADRRRMELDVPSAGSSILDAALEAGADLPFACKGGVCCTCRAKLVKGEVTMDVNYALEPAEVEAGFILTCQAHPVTDEVVVDFDQV
ncbi:MAG: 1,2-phenylacetyl-CoA epoxidase subunit PaaE [Pseudomonadota bacterium]